MKLVLFSLALFLVLVKVGADECLTFSWASSQVDQLAAQGTDLEKGTNFANALSQLWSVFSSSSDPQRSELYYGLSSGNFYSVANCFSQDYANAPVCAGGTHYIFTARNAKYFGDAKLHAFKTDGNGKIVGNAYYASASAYDPRVRPWYQQGSGWTDAYTFSDGTTGVSYYHSFDGGVAGGDRVGSDQCGPCLEGSFPIPWSLTWAAAQSGGANIQTLFGIQTYAQGMIAHVKTFSTEIFKEVFIGFDNGNYYAIGDCRNAVEGCKHEGYKLYTRNVYVFNNDSLVSFQLDTSGKIASKASYGKSYDPRVRPWYIQGQGWTATYLSSTTNTYVKAYSQQLSGGVASATISVDSQGSCFQGRNAMYLSGESTYPSVPILDDDCLSVSWAPSEVDTLAATPGLETGTNLANALSQLWAIYSSSSNPYGVSLYYGLKSGNFYSLTNCKSPVMANSVRCNGKSQFVFTARNSAKFGDSLTHTYNTDDNGNLVGAPFTKSTSAYNPTQRPWFQSGFGWTSPYSYASTGYTGVTYYHSFSGGVAGGDRFNGEPCSPCLAASFPIPWAVTWASRESGGASLVSVLEIQSYAQKMISNVRGFTSEVFLSVYVAFDNGYYYGISDCRNENVNCADQGFLLSTRNDLVFGNDSLVQYQLDLQGRIISDETYFASYDPRVRPFYTQGLGWAPVTSVGDIMVRSYSSMFEGGVTAASVPVTTTGRCYLGRSGQPERSSSLPLVEGSATHVHISLFTVLMAVLVAAVW